MSFDSDVDISVFFGMFEVLKDSVISEGCQQSDHNAMNTLWNSYT